MEDHLNLLDLCDTGTRALGPGLRFAMWVQGCPFNCKGCISPEGIPMVAANLVPIAELVNRIVGDPRFYGITISGGEPFLQASKLCRLLALVRNHAPHLNVVVYTGFKLEELNWTDARELLKLTDVLIDGRYIQALNDYTGLRGSSNQQVHFLTDRLVSFEAEFISDERKVEVHVYDSVRQLIGVPGKPLNI